MSALQAAVQRAQEPVRPATDLQVECRAAGIAPAALATLIGGAHLAGRGRMAAPNLARLIKEIIDDATTMVRAVSAGKSAEGEAMAARLAAIRASGLLESANEIEIAHVARLTGRGAGRCRQSAPAGDGPAQGAQPAGRGRAPRRSLSGAHVFGLQPEDRAPVESFMQGLNETRALKFNHPGLDTMATRSNGRLLIQNDIGTTDAHVVVIAVRENSVTVTYTDVHRARAKFFIALFDKFRGEMERARSSHRGGSRRGQRLLSRHRRVSGRQAPPIATPFWPHSARRWYF